MPPSGCTGGGWPGGRGRSGRSARSLCIRSTALVVSHGVEVAALRQFNELWDGLEFAERQYAVRLLVREVQVSVKKGEKEGTLADLLADALGAAGRVAERVPGRVWQLGRVPAGGRAWPAFLA